MPQRIGLPPGGGDRVVQSGSVLRLVCTRSDQSRICISLNSWDAATRWARAS